MSTQSSSSPSIPFSITHPQQNLRLLELPPDLLELLTSNSKPEILELKSASPNSNTSSKGLKSKDEFLHFCTNDKVWAVRQVSTSNSAYIIIPTSTSTPSKSEPGPTASTSNADLNAMALDSPPPTAAHFTMTAISKPTSTLELIPLPLTPNIAETAIRAILPIYPLPSPSSHFYPPISLHSHSTLLTALPLPTALLKRTARALFVIQLRPQGTEQAFIPSPALLLHSYRLLDQFLHAPVPKAKSEAVDLATFDVISAGDTLTLLALEEGEVYACVANAILERFVELDLTGQEEENYREKYSLEGKVRGKEMTLWLGALLVRCACEESEEREKGKGMEEEELLGEWRGLLPQAWWGWCSIDTLVKDYECVVEEGKVILAETQTSTTAGTGGEGSASASASVAAAAGVGKRKWHERFAKEREKN